MSSFVERHSDLHTTVFVDDTGSITASPSLADVADTLVHGCHQFSALAKVLELKISPKSVSLAPSARLHTTLEKLLSQASLQINVAVSARDLGPELTLRSRRRTSLLDSRLRRG